MCVITCSLSPGHSNHGAWWWVGFLDRKVWPLSMFFTIFIIRAPRPDNLCRARDSGQTAVLMFLDLSAAVGRAGQHVPFPTHLQAPWLLVSQLASVLSQRDRVDTFPSIPFIFKLFLNSVLPHPMSIDVPSLFQTMQLFNMKMRRNRLDTGHFKALRVLFLGCGLCDGRMPEQPRIWVSLKAGIISNLSEV